MYFKWLHPTTSRSLICTRKSLLFNVVNETFLSHCKRSERKWQCLKIQVSHFHTTRKLYYPTPLFVCLASIIGGHYVRRWWSKQTPAQQKMFIRWYTERRHLLYGSLGLTCIILFLYCQSRMQRDIVVNAPRLILFDETERLKNSKLFYRFLVQSKENVVPLSSPLYKRVAASIRRLGKCNNEIFQDTDWNITIIHRMFDIVSIPNVLILPDKNIIIVADIFNFIKSNDQLTFILAHEMSHEMLLHTSEALSVGLIFDIATTIFTFLIWLLYNGGIAASLCSGLYILSSVLFAWYKRTTEAEADAVGLKLAAKSCIDLREVLVFWEIMKTFEELSGAARFQFQLFMEHPSLEKRQRMTLEMMPEALELRNNALCPPLPKKDPREMLPVYKKDIENHLHRRPRILGMRL